MSKSITIFKGSSGLNTKTDPARLRFNPKTGISDLAACKNIDIDDTGRPSRRAGYTATTRTEAWHSLFGCGAYALGVTGNALAVIEADMSKTKLRNVTTGARMSYVRDVNGEKEQIFYANGYEKGRIVNKVSYTWPLITPTGPEATIKTLYEAPTGHILEIRNLRMFIAKDNFIYYSEPNTYHAYRLASNFFGFPSRIKMMVALDAGLLVSDSESLYFLQGEIAPALREMPKQIKLAEYPAVENTQAMIPSSRFGEGVPGVGVMFTTTAGICFCSSTGEFMNISERKLDIPSGISGASLYKDGHFITTIN